VTSRICKSESVLARSVDDQTVLLDLETGECFVLNELAGRMWSLLREGADRDAVVERLGKEYEVDVATLQGDVDNLISTLLERGLAGNDSPEAG